MKSLDEIINEMTACIEFNNDCTECPEIISCTGRPWRSFDKDALYYLKEYRDECNHIYDVEADYIHLRDEAARIFNERMNELRLNNPPLKWEQLKKMEGKPVWIEEYYHSPEHTYKFWVIIKNFDYHENGEMMFTSNGYLHKSDMGTDWNAYRKEI